MRVLLNLLRRRTTTAGRAGTVGHHSCAVLARQGAVAAAGCLRSVDVDVVATLRAARAKAVIAAKARNDVHEREAARGDKRALGGLQLPTKLWTTGGGLKTRQWTYVDQERIEQRRRDRHG